MNRSIFTHHEFFTSLLVQMNIVPRNPSLRALGAVAIAESPGDDPGFNPLNVVQPWPGAINYNDIGVKRYANFRDGVLATNALLQGSRWFGVRTALRVELTRYPIIDEFRKVYASWGSHPSFSFSTGDIDVRLALLMAAS